MSLKKNFSLMTTGRGLYVVCQWLLLVTIARLADAEALGRFTYALALTSPIIIFTQFNMRAYMATDTGGEFRFVDYRLARLLGVAASLVVIAGLALIGGDDSVTLWVVLLVALYKGFESISDVHYGVMQKHERFRPFALSLVWRGALSVTSLAVALALTGSIIAGVAAVAVAWLGLLLIFDMPAAGRARRGAGDTEGGLGSAWPAIVACFPFGITLALMSLRINVPVYFIEARLGVDQVGYYSAVAYFIVAGRLVTGSLVQTSSPRLARLFNSGDLAAYRQLLVKLVGVALVLAVAGVAGAWLLGEWVLRLAYGAEYGAYARLLLLIMLAAGVGYFAQLTGMCLTVARYRRMLIVSNLLGTAAVAALAARLVPTMQLEGG
ncbi:MAG: lipopolysaccharide biosynthesis protein, partial [Pseudomonadota bacterium]